MKCQVCEGTGKVECVGSQPDDWYTSKCDECIGTGVIEDEEVARYTILGVTAALTNALLNVQRAARDNDIARRNLLRELEN